MSRRYAATTSVSVDRSQQQIRSMLRDHEASHIAFMEQRDPARAVIAFSIDDLPVNIEVPMPDSSDPEFRYTNHNPPRERTAAQVREAIEQVERSQWRAAALLLQAKFAAVDAGIRTIQQELFPDLMMADGKTVFQYSMPLLAESGMAKLLMPGDRP